MLVDGIANEDSALTNGIDRQSPEIDDDVIDVDTHKSLYLCCSADVHLKRHKLRLSYCSNMECFHNDLHLEFTFCALRYCPVGSTLESHHNYLNLCLEYEGRSYGCGMMLSHGETVPTFC